MSSLEIYLVRHGQTEFNLEGRIQGWADSPLTDLGRKQAAEAGEQFAAQNIQFDMAFSSPSWRAMETAKIILEHAKAEDVLLSEIDELQEYHFGGFEGHFATYLYELAAKISGFQTGAEWLESYRNGSYNRLAEAVCRLDSTHQAESESEFLSRVQTAFHQVIAACPIRDEKPVRALVVSHGMTITAMLKLLDPTCIKYKSVPNASVTHLRYVPFQKMEIVGIGGQGLLGSKDRPNSEMNNVKRTLKRSV